MSKALYRKYRSKKLDEIIGQKHITDILSNAIKNGRLSHAYLFTGPRGVGKTSVARILAHEINSLEYNEDATHLDIIEIDAASNNSVEDIRDLREKVQIAPVSSEKKIYIIDEVHMLSKSAFNALLKTLEEPPEHIVFILATTNVEKLPATIISRTQRFSFRPINPSDAIEHLSHIAKKEGIKVTKDALELIAMRSEGSFRDSISLLDQLASLATVSNVKEITAKLIEDMLGMAPNDIINKIVDAVENKELALVIELIEKTYNEGIDSQALAKQLTEKISRIITAKPQFLTLLDSLIEVEKSPQPQLKLISVLGLAASSKQSAKSIALSAPAREISASIADLKEQVSKEKNDIDADSKQDCPFDWNKLVETTKRNNVALYSVISKCSYEIDDNSLTIYAGNKFYKKKLDDTKYRAALNSCLEELGLNDLDVCTIPNAAPPKDSQAAAIAVIMGGGVEVPVEAM